MTSHAAKLCERGILRFHDETLFQPRNVRLAPPKTGTCDCSSSLIQPHAHEKLKPSNVRVFLRFRSTLQIAQGHDPPASFEVGNLPRGVTHEALVASVLGLHV